MLFAVAKKEKMEGATGESRDPPPEYVCILTYSNGNFLGNQRG